MLKRKGQAGILGAVLIAFMIIASIATYMFLSDESSRYINTVNRAMDRREAKISERLHVLGYPDQKLLEIENVGDRASHIVAFVLLNNQTGDMQFYRYDLTLNVMDDVKVTFNEMQNYPPYVAGVLTDLGNMFWDEVVTGGGNGGGGNNGEFGLGGGGGGNIVRLFGNPFNTTYIYISDGDYKIHVVDTSSMSIVRTISVPHPVISIAPTYSNRYLYIAYNGEYGYYSYVLIYDMRLGDYIDLIQIPRITEPMVLTSGERSIIFGHTSGSNIEWRIYIISSDGSLIGGWYPIISYKRSYGVGAAGVVPNVYWYNWNDVRLVFHGAISDSGFATIGTNWDSRELTSVVFVVKDSGPIYIFEDGSLDRNYPYRAYLTIFFNFNTASMKVYAIRDYVVASYNYRRRYYDTIQANYDKTVYGQYIIYYYWRLEGYISLSTSYFYLPLENRFLEFYDTGFKIYDVVPSYSLYRDVSTSGKHPPVFRSINNDYYSEGWIAFTRDLFVIQEMGYIEVYNWDGDLLHSVNLSTYDLYRGSEGKSILFDVNTYTIYMLVQKTVGVSLIKISP